MPETHCSSPQPPQSPVLQVTPSHAVPRPTHTHTHLYVVHQLPRACQAGLSPLVHIEAWAVLVHGHLANDGTLPQLHHNIHQHLQQAQVKQGGDGLCL